MPGRHTVGPHVDVPLCGMTAKAASSGPRMSHAAADQLHLAAGVCPFYRWDMEAV